MLFAHDWSYHYSDDSRVWTAGDRSLAKLKSLAAEMNCPFELDELSHFVHEFILEKFEFRNSGQPRDTGYYKIGCKYKNIAPLKRSELITQSRADEIRAWLSENDK
jgi:hypothetical protein